MSKYLRIVDTTLRDGMHSVAHQFTPEQMVPIAKAMDDAGIDVIEVSHGDGLGGSCIQYGRAAATDEEYLKAVARYSSGASWRCCCCRVSAPRNDLDLAADLGAKVARIATHVTEADISRQHIGLAKNRNLEVMCFLMMAHMAPVETMVHNAKLMESDGADYIYVVDSSGYMLPPEVRQRVAAMKIALSCSVGFHAHNNLGLAIGNTLAAIEAGVDVVDGSLRGFGAGGGNAPTETLVAVLTRLGLEIGVDLYKILDAAKLADPYKRPAKDNIECDADAGLRRSLLQLPAAHGPGGRTVSGRSPRHPGRVGQAKDCRRPRRYDYRSRLRIGPQELNVADMTSFENPNLESAEFLSPLTRGLAEPSASKMLDVAAERSYKQIKSLTDGIPHFQDWRETAQRVKSYVIANLDKLLVEFERNMSARGVTVLYANDAVEANRLVMEIARKHQVKSVVKAKSMVSEELDLNHVLADAGIRAVETDLGEYIVQLAGQRPVHIVAPAMHLTAGEVGRIFAEKLGEPYTEEHHALTAVARRRLRDEYLAAGMGISGCNFAIADTGTLVLIENEGNAGLSTATPPIHVALVGIEKILPKIDYLPAIP